MGWEYFLGIFGIHNTAGKKALKDCQYDIKKYILNDKYYELTKQYGIDVVRQGHLSRIKTYFILWFSLIIALILGALLIYFLVLLGTASKHLEACIGAGICGSIMFIIFIGLLIWVNIAFLAKLSKDADLFCQLVDQNIITNKVYDYPQLIIDGLFYERKIPDLNFDKFTNAGVQWLVYGFEIFFCKLYQYYLDHHHNHTTSIKPINK